MSKSAIALLVLLVAGVLGGVLWHKSQERARCAAGAKEAAVALLRHTPAFKNDEVYVRRLIDESHKAAFDASFAGGGLFAPSSYDEQAYLEALWREITRRATDDNRPEVVDALPAIDQNPDHAAPTPQR